MIKAEIRIRDRKNPSSTITMDLEAYKTFIEEQAKVLGILDKKDDKEKEIMKIKSLIRPIPPEEFEKAFKRAEEMLNEQLKTKKEKFTCPRCENEEFSPGANYCKICGLPVKPEGEENKDE